MMGARTQAEREVEKRVRSRRNNNGGNNGGRGESYETKKRLTSVVDMTIDKVNVLELEKGKADFG